MSMSAQQALQYFPTRISKGGAYPTKLKYLLMAPPKWGKTTFFSSIPNCLLLAFEEGHLFVDCFKVVITKWDNASRRDRGPSEDPETGIIYSTAMEIVEALEAADPCPFQFVIIDTLDVATKMAAEYSCKMAGIAHPSDGGKYGKGWDLYQTTPVRLFYNRLVKMGFGVAAITHVKEGMEEDQFGTERFVRETSLSGGVQRFVLNNSDLIMNGIWGPRRKGRSVRDRIISFDANNEIVAGSRVRGVHVPLEYMVDPPTDKEPGAPWAQWSRFFSDSPNAGIQAEQYYLNNYKSKPRDLDENEIEDKSTKPQPTK